LAPPHFYSLKSANKNAVPPKKLLRNFATLALSTPALGEAKGAAAAAPCNNGKKENAMSDKKPAAKVSIFPVHAIIWRNGSDEKPFYSVNFERSYKDKSGQWKRTASFNPHDLLTLAKVADMAHTDIERLRRADKFEIPELESESGDAEKLDE
jgi:hypothetical protein